MGEGGAMNTWPPGLVLWTAYKAARNHNCYICNYMLADYFNSLEARA